MNDPLVARALRLARCTRKEPLTAVPVLAEPRTPESAQTTMGSQVIGEARESTDTSTTQTWDVSDGRSSQKRKATACLNKAADSRGGSQKPSGATAADWREACERAQRATDYAAMFPYPACASQEVYQSPLWQWENRVKPFDRRGK